MTTNFTASNGNLIAATDPGIPAGRRIWPDPEESDDE